MEVLFVCELDEDEENGRKFEAPGKSLNVIEGKNELDFDIVDSFYPPDMTQYAGVKLQ